MVVVCSTVCSWRLVACAPLIKLRLNWIYSTTLHATTSFFFWIVVCNVERINAIGTQCMQRAICSCNPLHVLQVYCTCTVIVEYSFSVGLIITYKCCLQCCTRRPGLLTVDCNLIAWRSQGCGEMTRQLSNSAGSLQKKKKEKILCAPPPKKNPGSTLVWDGYQ